MCGFVGKIQYIFRFWLDAKYDEMLALSKIMSLQYIQVENYKAAEYIYCAV